MKHLLLLLALLGCTAALKAQDNVYTRKGDVLQVHVKKITGSLIYYTAPGGGPQRYIRKDAVERIVYKSGREVVLPDPNAPGRRPRPVPANLLTVAPLHIMYFGNLGGLGIGADFEHYFGERHRISVHLPVYVGACSNDDPELDNDPYTEIYPFYTAPGIRFHPIDLHRRVDYAVGVSVVVGNINQTTYYEKSYLGLPNEDRQWLLTAVTLDNDIHFFSRKKFAFGVHTAVGPVLGGFGEGGKWLVQLGIKLGWRF